MENGFYAVIDDQLQFGQMVSFVDNTVLVVELKDTYTYPIQGWYYFDTRQEARTFFNVVEEEQSNG